MPTKIDWSYHNKAWQASVLTQQAYCEQAGISVGGLGHYRNRTQMVQDTLCQDRPRASLQFTRIDLPANIDAEQAIEGQPVTWAWEIELQLPGLVALIIRSRS